MQQRFINLVQTSVQNLVDRMELLATKEEVQGVRNDLAAHIQDFMQFKQSHDKLTTYFYCLYPSVTPGMSIPLNILVSCFPVVSYTSTFATI